MRRRVGWLLLVAAEVGLVCGYARAGATWQLLVHSLLGLAVGLGFAAVAAAATGRDVGAVRPAVTGQAIALVPDLVLVSLHRPHGTWSDLFLGHVVLHVTAAPLLLTCVAFVVAGWAWWLAGPMRLRRTGGTLAIVVLTVVGLALTAHRPLPNRLSEFPGQEPGRTTAVPAP